MRTVMFVRLLDWLIGRFSNRVDVLATTAAMPANTDGVAFPAAPEARMTVSDGARHLLLAARLSSVAKLNKPAGRIKHPRAAGSSSAVPTSRIGATRQRQHSVGRRIARPATTRSADVIPFPTVRHTNAPAGTTRRAA